MSACSLLRQLPRASSSRGLISTQRSLTSSPSTSSPSLSSSPPPPPPSPLTKLDSNSLTGYNRKIAKLPRYYPWTIDPTLPVGDLFSAEGTKTVAIDYHQALLDKLRYQASGSPLETDSVLQLVIKTAQDAIADSKAVDRHAFDQYWRARRRKMFNIGCNILNNNFFLSSLRDPRKPGSYPPQLEKQVVASFGSSTGLEQTLLGTAEGLSSSGGWIWLVQEERNALDGLSLIATSGPGTLLVQAGKPVAPLPNLGLTVNGGYVYGETLHAAALASLLQKETTTSSLPSSLPSDEPLLQGESTTTSSELPFATNPYAPTSPTNASAFGDLTSFRRIIPLACLSMQESAYMGDHGVWGKQDYVKAWLRAVDWELVEQRMFYHGASEGKQIVDTRVGGRGWNQ